MTSELRKTAPEAFQPLDSVDHGIIAELQSDARVRVAELGRRVGLVPPAVGRAATAAGGHRRRDVPPLT